MAYFIQQRNITGRDEPGHLLSTAQSKAAAKKQVTEVIKRWRNRYDNRTAVKFDREDSPIGYRYELRHRTRTVAYLEVVKR